jgi:acetolactate synthase-1/2/3 large subunit
MLDSVPVVFITGNVPNALIGKDAFQEIDITGITLPMTKHNYLVRTADEIPYAIAEAFHLARSGRPGPVHVDITKDALMGETSAAHPTAADIEAGLPGYKPKLDGHPRQIKLLAEAIAGAQRPVILAGHGVLIAGAERELLELARTAQIPITWTLLGIGVIDETDPLAYGYMGMHGWKHVNRAIQSADLLIGIGMRFDDRVTGNVRTYAPKAKIAHIDIDPAEIGKNVVADLPIVGDAKHVLDALLPLVTKVDPATRAALAAFAKGCSRPTSLLSALRQVQILMRTSPPTSVRIRCGSHATADSGVPTRTSHPADSVRWASPSLRRWAPPLRHQTRFRGRSPATAGSR